MGADIKINWGGKTNFHGKGGEFEGSEQIEIGKFAGPPEGVACGVRRAGDGEGGIGVSAALSRSMLKQMGLVQKEQTSRD
jgi:hypothetical protein